MHGVGLDVAQPMIENLLVPHQARGPISPGVFGPFGLQLAMSDRRDEGEVAILAHPDAGLPGAA